MELTLDRILEHETSRRNILKYGTLAGLSLLAGVKALNTGAALPNISAPLQSSSISLDYTVKPYNIFLVSENVHYVKGLLNNSRLEHIYLYSHTLQESFSSKVTSHNNLSSLLLSLGSLIPFDYDISSLDMKAWKVREAFLYISGVYADVQNNSKASLNEEKLLSTLNILGTYNRSIYGINTHSMWHNDIVAHNRASFPIGNIIVL